MKKTFVVEVQLPFGWWTALETDSEKDAIEFEKKQKQNGVNTRLYSRIPAV